MGVLMHAGTCSCGGREQAQAAAAADREQVYRTVAFEVGVERFHVGAELGFHSSSSFHHQSARVVVVCLPAKGPWDCFFLQGLCLFERPFVGLHSVVPLLIGDQLMTLIIITEWSLANAPGCVSVRGERDAHAAIVAQGGRWLSAIVSFRISGVMTMRPSWSSGAHPNFHHRIRTLCHSNPSVETAS